MLKPQIEKKAKIVEDIRERVSQAQIGILADFTGLKVESMTLLRRQVKEAGGELKVTKNTLLRRAAGDGNLIEFISQELKGPNALVLGYEDPVALAKILIKFAQDKPLLKIKGGVMAGRPLTVQEVDSLSKLPAREVLLAQLLGLLQSPPQALVTVLSGVIRNFLNVLVAIRDQKGEGEASAVAAEARRRRPRLSPLRRPRQQRLKQLRRPRRPRPKPARGKNQRKRPKAKGRPPRPRPKAGTKKTESIQEEEFPRNNAFRESREAERNIRLTVLAAG